MIELDRWSCDERDRKSCRNGHGCHCREITILRQQLTIAMTALRRVNSLAEKNARAALARTAAQGKGDGE